LLILAAIEPRQASPRALVDGRLRQHEQLPSGTEQVVETLRQSRAISICWTLVRPTTGTWCALNIRMSAAIRIG